MMFLCAGALSVCLLLLFGLIGILTWHGMGHFWPSPLELFTLQSGEQFLAERQGRRIDRGQSLVEASEDAAKRYELYLKLGNRDVYPTSFRWVAESEIARVETPEDVVVCERYSNGVFYGRIRQIRKDEVVLADGQAASLAWMRDWLPDILASKEAAESSSSSEAAVLELVDGRVVQGTEPLTEIYRIYEPNRMGLGERVEHFLLELWDFVTESPRHANTEGGIFPAIFGTVLMVFLMTVFVTPFGVLAALYLREYAKQGPFVSFIRIAVNNLAGVPSIVFGLFGLGFFVYFVGGGIDELFFPHRGNSPTFGTGGLLWASLTLALLTLPVVIVATEEGLASVPGEVRTGSLALGATKWETIWRVVLPAASPGILTGLILAICPSCRRSRATHDRRYG
jgi:phosphate transport system permease protein